jgi:hypothetical protein
MGGHEEWSTSDAGRGKFTVFVTMDGNIEHQQNLAALSFGIVIIGAASNRIADLLPVLPELLQIIDIVQPGEARRVGTSPKE